MPTVFVTQEPWPDRNTGQPRYDFTPAMRYGKLKILLGCEYNPNDNLAQDLLDAGLNEFQEGDSLVLAGHPAVIGVATALAAEIAPVRLLIWSGRLREYEPIIFDSENVKWMSN